MTAHSCLLRCVQKRAGVGSSNPLVATSALAAALALPTEEPPFAIATVRLQVRNFVVLGRGLDRRSSLDIGNALAASLATAGIAHRHRSRFCRRSGGLGHQEGPHAGAGRAALQR